MKIYPDRDVHEYAFEDLWGSPSVEHRHAIEKGLRQLPGIGLLHVPCMLSGGGYKRLTFTVHGYYKNGRIRLALVALEDYPADEYERVWAKQRGAQ